MNAHCSSFLNPPYKVSPPPAQVSIRNVRAVSRISRFSNHRSTKLLIVIVPGIKISSQPENLSIKVMKMCKGCKILQHYYVCGHTEDEHRLSWKAQQFEELGPCSDTVTTVAPHSRLRKLYSQCQPNQGTVELANYPLESSMECSED